MDPEEDPNQPPLKECRGWLKRNKIFFETIGVITLTIMGIVVSIATYQILNYQTAIMEEEHHPVFQFESNVSNGHEMITISNVGSPFNDISVKGVMLLHLYYGKDKVDKEVRIPISGYFPVVKGQQTVIGPFLILSDYTNSVNKSLFPLEKYDEEALSMLDMGNYEKINKYLRDWVWNSSYNYPNKYGDTNLYFQITYMDIFDKYHEEYRAMTKTGGVKVSNDEGKEIFNYYFEKKQKYSINLQRGAWAGDYTGKIHYVELNNVNWTHYFDEIGTVPSENNIYQEI